MTERIDHAATALTMIDGIGTLGSTWAAEQAVAMAQVHASLALVEQQRIANLITYAADVDVIRSGNHDLNVEIREALGL